jgi:hypothetical protein
VISIKKLEFLDLGKWGLLKTPKFLAFCPNSTIKDFKGELWTPRIFWSFWAYPKI